MVMRCKLGGGEGYYMWVMEASKIGQSHVKILIGDDFMWWLDLEVFSEKLAS